MAFRNRIASAEYSSRVKTYFDDGPQELKLDIRRLLTEQDADTHLYVCGPTGFMKWALDSAFEAGWNDQRLHREYFNAAPHNTENKESFSIKLARSGKVISVSAHQTVVEALACHGVAVPVSCEQGVCGTCLTRVIDGQPDHRDMFMTDAERARNDQFTPCCSRSKSPVLVLDL